MERAPEWSWRRSLAGAPLLDQFRRLPPARRRIYGAFIALTLATVPFYCLGFALLAYYGRLQASAGAVPTPDALVMTLTAQFLEDTLTPTRRATSTPPEIRLPTQPGRGDARGAPTRPTSTRGATPSPRPTLSPSATGVTVTPPTASATPTPQATKTPAPTATELVPDTPTVAVPTDTPPVVATETAQPLPDATNTAQPPVPAGVQGRVSNPPQ